MAAIVLNRHVEWIRVRIERHLALSVAILAIVLVAGFIIAFRLI
jgi:hypothetical protein